MQQIRFRDKQVEPLAREPCMLAGGNP